MHAVTQTPKRLNTLEQIPVHEQIQKHVKALEEAPSISSIDQFYLDMLEQFLPANQKARYLKLLKKEIVAVFRIDQIMAAVLYSDSTIESFSHQATEHINSLRAGPLSVSRISYILHKEFSDRVSVDYFCKDNPTYHDLKLGYLYSEEDLKAGFTADETSTEELMCDWLQSYQQWMHDYLYFNLAQITKETDRLPPKTLSLLQNYSAEEKEQLQALL
ncbi:hypothetical protein ACMXYN_07690 [Neptuniibacter sp. PT8_73]|uniref:hypothetical protein n=1 Tax=unclassified Neptuniibacter TaxID=2630693 RepID=UPI0039F46590